MIKTINIGAILLLIYFYKHIDQYSIQVYESSTVSMTVVDILHAIPRPGIWLLATILVILGSLFIKTRWKYVGYTIALLVVDISFALILSELALESYTPYYILQVYHPISLETKLDYLQNEVIYCYSQILPELAKYSIDELNLIKDHLESKLNTTYVSMLNAQGLSQYARHLVMESFNYRDTIQYPYGILFTTAGFVIIKLIDQVFYNLIN
jgi:hypothetical protein